MSKYVVLFLFCCGLALGVFPGERYWIFANVGRMAFIDSELAKRGQEGKSARAETGPTSTSTTTSTSARQPAEGHGEKERAKEPDMQRQPATLGRLLEIDLGDEARDRNVEMTNQARRRMDGEVIEEDQAPKGKVKLGRDGKPWRPRKRRGSEDIKRDKMVEDILRENRCESSHRSRSISYADLYPRSGYLRRATRRTSDGQRRPGGRRYHRGGLQEGVHGCGLAEAEEEGRPGATASSRARREEGGGAQGPEAGREQECAGGDARDVAEEPSQEVDEEEVEVYCLWLPTCYIILYFPLDMLQYGTT